MQFKLLLFSATVITLYLSNAGAYIPPPPPATTPKPSKYDSTYQQTSSSSPIGSYLDKLIEIKETKGIEISKISLDETFPQLPNDIKEKLVQIIELTVTDIRASLLYSIVSDDKIAKFMLKLGADKNFKDENGDSALHFAAKRGNLKVSEWLVDKQNININVKNKKGRTPLHKAAETEKPASIQFLITFRANVNEKDNEGNTALHIAAPGKSLNIVKQLINAKIDVNSQNTYNNTALYTAIISEHENINIIKYLINLPNIDINIINELHTTALKGASFANKINTIKIIIESGKSNEDTLQYIYPAFLTAIQNNNTDVFQWIINKYPNNIKQDETDISPLINAIAASNIETLKQLFQTGKFDVNSRDFLNTSPLSFAASLGNFEIVKYLIKDLNANYDSSILEGPVASDQIEKVKYLIENYKLDLNNLKSNPLLKASEYGSLESIKYLISTANVDINVKDEYYGRNALLTAASYGKLDMVKFLIEKAKFEVNTKDNEGKTALHLAAEKNYINVMDYLSKVNGIDINALDNNGKTAEQLKNTEGIKYANFNTYQVA